MGQHIVYFKIVAATEKLNRAVEIRGQDERPSLQDLEDTCLSEALSNIVGISKVMGLTSTMIRSVAISLHWSAHVL